MKGGLFLCSAGRLDTWSGDSLCSTGRLASEVALASMALVMRMTFFGVSFLLEKSIAKSFKSYSLSSLCLYFRLPFIFLVVSFVLLACSNKSKASPGFKRVSSRGVPG